MVYFRPALDGRMDGDGNSKLMIYNLERAIRLMPRHSWQYTIVIDCQGTAVVGRGVRANFMLMLRSLGGFFGALYRVSGVWLYVGATYILLCLSVRGVFTRTKMSSLLPSLACCGPSRHGAEAAAPGGVHEEDVQAAEPPLPHAARARALHQRGAQRDALLEGGVAAAASENESQDAPHSFNVGLFNKIFLTKYFIFCLGVFLQDTRPDPYYTSLLYIQHRRNAVFSPRKSRL